MSLAEHFKNGPTTSFSFNFNKEEEENKEITTKKNKKKNKKNETKQEERKEENIQEVIEPLKLSNEEKINEISEKKEETEKGIKKSKQTSQKREEKKNYVVISSNDKQIKKKPVKENKQTPVKTSNAKTPITPVKVAPPAPIIKNGPSILSHRDPELTEDEKQKRKYGSGVNLSSVTIAGKQTDSQVIGKHKRSLMNWAPPPPGFEPIHSETLRSHQLSSNSNDILGLETQMTSLSVEEKPSQSSTYEGWSPFSFGFQF